MGLKSSMMYQVRDQHYHLADSNHDFGVSHQPARLVQSFYSSPTPQNALIDDVDAPQQREQDHFFVFSLLTQQCMAIIAFHLHLHARCKFSNVLLLSNLPRLPFGDDCRVSETNNDSVTRRVDLHIWQRFNLLSSNQFS